jgi:hypothetical protein
MITKDDRIATGVVDYFPNALAAVGRHSRLGNEKHNPGEEMHWAFDKSTAHADAAMSHFAQRGQIDPETGEDYDVGALWRMLAMVETRLLKEGAKPGRAVVFADPEFGPIQQDLFAALKGGPDDR